MAQQSRPKKAKAAKKKKAAADTPPKTPGRRGRKPAAMKAAEKSGVPALKPGGATPSVMGNVTDATIRKHINNVLNAKAAVDRAVGTHRAALKAAKADGMEPSDISWYQTQKKRDVPDIDRETARRNRIAVVMDLPLTVQLGLFDANTTVADHIEKTKAGKAKGPSDAGANSSEVSAEALALAEEGGKKSYDLGMDVEQDNPYEEGSGEWSAWRKGFTDEETAQGGEDGQRRAAE